MYEDGTPEQIFDHPMKERTRAFVKKLRTWEYKINSVDFDLYAMNAGMEEFTRKHDLRQLQIHNLELVTEELVLHQIICRVQDILLQVGYFEVDDRLELTLTYGGEAFNPFDTDKEDVLSMLLVRQLTRNPRYKNGEKNCLTIEISPERILHE